MYRKFSEGGHTSFDAIQLSRHFARRWVELAASNETTDVSNEEVDVRITTHGIPRFVAQISPKGRTFRIYCHSVEEQRAVIKRASRGTSFQPFAEGFMGYRIHYADLTGIFLTTPETSPCGAFGRGSYKFYVDFTLPDNTGLLQMNTPEVLLIPGPMRISPVTLARAKTIINGAAGSDTGQDIQDIIEIVRMFGDDVPEYRIPIKVVESGKL